MKELKIAPENLEVAEAYLTTLSIQEVSQVLDLPTDKVASILKKREVKSFLDTVYQDVGYRNRNKLGNLMDTLIDKKLEELEEADTGSSKDIADLVLLAHKMALENKKLDIETTPSTQVNIQQNNYDSLVERILKA